MDWLPESDKAGAIGRDCGKELEFRQRLHMKSPFPGMDPFIEAQRLWGDFHDNLIIDMQRAIQRQLPGNYVARVADRTFVEQDDPDLELLVKTRFGPDVEVQKNQAVRSQSSLAAKIGEAAVADPPRWADAGTSRI